VKAAVDPATGAAMGADEAWAQCLERLAIVTDVKHGSKLRV